MIRNKIPIIKLTTPATPIDRKGGKDGVRIIQVNGETIYVPEQMERADTVAADKRKPGQLKAFEEAGQKGLEIGKQPFNTNMFYFDHGLLHSILQDLAGVIGEEELGRIISPTLIPKPAKKGKDGRNYVPADSAIGSAVHNLNAFFQTTTNPEVRQILKNHGVERLLGFVDVPRTEFFAPVKASSDFWLERYSGWYHLNAETMALEESYPGATPPEIDLTGDYWKEIQNVVDSLGHSKVEGLKKLEIDGVVVLPENTQLSGDVVIRNATGETVNFNATEVKQQLQQFYHQDVFSLEDVELRIEKGSDGHIQVKTQNGNVTYRPWQIALSFLVPLSGLIVPLIFLFHGAAIFSAAMLAPTLFGGWALVVGIVKQSYAVSRLRSEGLNGGDLLKALFRSAPIETLNLETGEAAGLTGIVPLAHTLRSHRAFHIENEFVAHLLDLITIPLEAVHALVVDVLYRIAPAASVEAETLRHSPLAQAVGSERVARLLPSGTELNGSGGLVLPVVPSFSRLTSRLKVLFGFNAQDGRLLASAYQRLETSA